MVQGRLILSTGMFDVARVTYMSHCTALLVVAGESCGSKAEQSCSCSAGLMKVGRGGNWLLLSFARIAAWCH